MVAIARKKKRSRKKHKKFHCSDTHKIIIRNLMYDFYIEEKFKLLMAKGKNYFVFGNVINCTDCLQI